MRDVVTDGLDVLGLVGVAAGVGAGAAQWIGWFGLAAAGGVLLAGSQLAGWLGRPGGEQR